MIRSIKLFLLIVLVLVLSSFIAIGCYVEKIFIDNINLYTLNPAISQGFTTQITYTKGLISSDAEVVLTPKSKDPKAITTAKYKIYHGPVIFSKDPNINKIFGTNMSLALAYIKTTIENEVLTKFLSLYTTEQPYSISTIIDFNKNFTTYVENKELTYETSKKDKIYWGGLKGHIFCSAKDLSCDISLNIPKISSITANNDAMEMSNLLITSKNVKIDNYNSKISIQDIIFKSNNAEKITLKNPELSMAIQDVNGLLSINYTAQVAEIDNLEKNETYKNAKFTLDVANLNQAVINEMTNSGTRPDLNLAIKLTESQPSIKITLHMDTPYGLIDHSLMAQIGGEGITDPNNIMQTLVIANNLKIDKNLFTTILKGNISRIKMMLNPNVDEALAINSITQVLLKNNVFVDQDKYYINIFGYQDSNLILNGNPTNYMELMQTLKKELMEIFAPTAQPSLPNTVTNPRPN